MFVLADHPLQFATVFISEIDKSLSGIEGAKQLSNIQKRWLTFCILATALSNTICWKAFERISLGTYSHASLSWMFCKSQICWSFLLCASIKVIISKYGIREGLLCLDDSDSRRAKQTSRIYHTYKVRNSKTGGYFNGQTIIFLLLVSDYVSIPVGFKFYKPDPVLSAWRKEDEKLKKKGVAKKARPKKPARDLNYPTKQQIALNLLQIFHKNHPNISIKAILADALYGTKDFMAQASTIFEGTQVISQLKKNQNVIIDGQKQSLEEHFSSLPEEKVKVKLRGAQEITVSMKHQRLFVQAHKKKRLIVAVKYEKQKEYRYLVATDLSWLAHTVLKAFSFRWLVEVFIEDWKLYEGWQKMAKQPGKKGSEQTLILSLLLDHALLLHPLQQVQIKNKLPALTVGSLLERVKVDSFFQFVQQLIASQNPQQLLNFLIQHKEEIFSLAYSTKHMSGQEWPHLAPSPFLKYYYQNVAPEGG